MCKRIAIILFLQLLATVTIAQGFYGSVQVIPKKIQQQMTGYTWHKGCPLPLSTMRYLTITYYGFDHKDHIGHMVILDQLALETLQIFQSLYQHKFPIERMILPYHYKSTNDSPSTTADNTVGYFCRSDAQTPNKYSSHSYGISIDINPRYNPAAISKNKVEPKNGTIYMNRNLKHPGMIKSGSYVANLFTHYGWKWGAYWDKAETDYMHFQKDMDHRYTCKHLIMTPPIK